DFSEVSDNAADYAAELAKISNARLIFYYIFTVPVSVADTPVMAIPIEDLEKENMKLLHALDKRVKAKHGKLETELRTQPGFVVDEIISFTREHEVDLVVMGVTGSGKTPGIMGSNATSVMHNAASPVIVVPHGYKFKKPATIALACDYKSMVPDETIDRFKSFVNLFHSKVLVFNVLKPKELATYEKAATEVNLENALGDLEHSLYFPASENLHQEINTFVDKHEAEMLVMFPHNYSFLKGLVHHSATKEMAFLTHVPLLSIHE
ncbi:MAG TPA: universal stress protein, partial [Bacteroidia bacterium]|nr:universal stress protein [Bacteroidia bacterium]